MIPLFPNTSESLVFTCRLTGIGRGWVGSSLVGVLLHDASPSSGVQSHPYPMVEKVTSCGSF